MQFYASLVMMLGAGFVTILSEFRPKLMSLFNSHAWTAQLKWNFGAESFVFQGVSVEVFHRSWLAKLSHVTLLVDPVAWFGIVYLTAGPIALAFVWLALLKQCVSFKNIRLTVTCAGFNLSLAILAQSTAEQEYVTSSAHWLCIISMCATVRALGHSFESVPPLLLGNESSRFLKGEGPTVFKLLQYGWSDPLRKGPTVVWLPLVGICSEVHAGMPYRLLPYVTYYIFRRFASLDANHWQVSYSQICAIANRVYHKGWDSWHVTKPMYTPVCVPT